CTCKSCSATVAAAAAGGANKGRGHPAHRRARAVRKPWTIPGPRCSFTPKEVPMANRITMTEELKIIETVLEAVVTRPLARLLYVSWLLGRYSLWAARCGWSWLRARWAAHRGHA